VHIRQRHSFDVLIVELLRAAFWINPVIHLMKSRITEVHEYLADHYATKEIGIEKYSKLLTLQVFKSFDFALSNNFHKSQVVKRIRMLRSARSGSIWINVGLLAPSMALLITVLACDVTEIDEIIPAKENEIIPLQEIVIENITSEGGTSSGEIFTIVEDQPEPIGGMGAFYEYVHKSLKYPSKAKGLGLESKVYVQFVIAPNGKLTDVKVVKGIGGGCDKEAERVVKGSSAWNPGTQRGENVNVRMILPITFKLG